MQVKKSSLVFFLSIFAVFFIAGILYFSNNEKQTSNDSYNQIVSIATKPNYLIEISGKKIVVDQNQWKFVDNSAESNYSKNYSAINKKDGEMFEQMITVFLNKMTDDRKSGEKITNSEYIEAFVVHPNSVTVQIRVDKGNYWVLSRQTFESQNNYPNQSNVSYSDLLLNFEDMQNKIDDTRYILNNDF